MANNDRTLVYTKVAALGTKEPLTAVGRVGGDWIKLTALQANTAPMSIYTLGDDGTTYTQVDEVVDSLEPRYIHSRGVFPIRGVELHVDGVAGEQMIVSWGTNAELP